MKTRQLGSSVMYLSHKREIVGVAETESGVCLVHYLIQTKDSDPKNIHRFTYHGEEDSQSWKERNYGILWKSLIIGVEYAWIEQSTLEPENKAFDTVLTEIRNEIGI